MLSSATPSRQRPARAAASARTRGQAAGATGSVSRASPISPDEQLLLPWHRRMVAQRSSDRDGRPSLRLFHGDKEVSFDEPELFAFGLALGRQPAFLARQALDWAPGLQWPRLQGLLADLVAHGVLLRATDSALADHSAQPGQPVLQPGPRPSPLPPGPCPRPRSWTEGTPLIQQLTGLAVDAGHLELVVPIFRVAHIALDADGRQVGESNVFPPALRLDIPTRWRTCLYDGSRHQPGRPMNVSALKCMRSHWGSVMALLLAVRSAYLARCPQAATATSTTTATATVWTVGHLERLSTAVLALPAYLLMRAGRPVANGRLHPALSSLFRVTDGLRMTLHQMLFVPVVEPTRRPTNRVTSADVLAYVERNDGFHSEHGVCAGPQAMVAEFLAVLIDGQPPRDGLPPLADDDLQDALAAIEPALDYALLGLQAHAAVFALWPAMTRAYADLLRVARRWAAAGSADGQALRDALQQHIDHVRQASYLATENWRADREQVYDDMFGQCGLALDGRLPQPPLLRRLAGRGGQDARDAAAGRALRQALAQRLTGPGTDADRAAIDGLAQGLMRFLRRARRALREADAAQARINHLLGRPPAARPPSLADLDAHNRLQHTGDDARPRLPFLPDEVSRLLGLRLQVTPAGITLEPA